MKYLVRLFKEQDHAEQFLAGQLRLMPAGFYIQLEAEGRGRADALEGAVSQKERLNIAFPVLCLIECEAELGGDGYTLPVSTDVLNDFCKDGGYAVAVEENDFIELIKPLLESSSHENQPAYYGKISYDINQESLTNCWRDATEVGNNLLHKNLDYSYQHEYRFVFTNPSHYTHFPQYGFNQPWRINMPDLHSCAYAFRIGPIPETEAGCVYLPLNKSHSAAEGAWTCWHQVLKS